MVGALVAALDNPVDLVMLLVIALLLFGKQLPEVARSLGKGIRELKESVNFDEVTDALNSVNEVRSAVSPGSIARAAIPGVAEFQDSVTATKEIANPLAAADTDSEEPVADAEAEPIPAGPALSEPSPDEAEAG